MPRASSRRPRPGKLELALAAARRTGCSPALRRPKRGSCERGGRRPRLLRSSVAARRSPGWRWHAGGSARSSGCAGGRRRLGARDRVPLRRSLRGPFCGSGPRRRRASRPGRARGRRAHRPRRNRLPPRAAGRRAGEALDRLRRGEGARNSVSSCSTRSFSRRGAVVSQAA